MRYYSTMDLWSLCIALLYGLVAGSFLNACIWRIPLRQSLLSRSFCPHCREKIAFYDNVPIVSFFLLKERCRHCRALISLRYPLVEAGTAILFVLLVNRFGIGWSTVPAILLTCLAVVLIFIDLDHMILPDRLTLPGALIGFLWSPWQDAVFYRDPIVAELTAYVAAPEQQALGMALIGSLLGLVVGGGLLWLTAEVYFRVRKVEGLGFGDVKMMAMVGAFLGWKYVLLTIFLGSLGGAAVGGLYIKCRRLDARHQLPFGVFLGLATLVVLLYGPEILNWYMGIYEM